MSSQGSRPYLYYLKIWLVKSFLSATSQIPAVTFWPIQTLLTCIVFFYSLSFKNPFTIVHSRRSFQVVHLATADNVTNIRSNYNYRSLLPAVLISNSRSSAHTCFTTTGQRYQPGAVTVTTVGTWAISYSSGRGHS